MQNDLSVKVMASTDFGAEGGIGMFLRFFFASNFVVVFRVRESMVITSARLDAAFWFFYFD